MSKLSNCIVCGGTPTSMKTHLHTTGCILSCWIIECVKEADDIAPLPWCEHRVTIYGKDQEEAEERWNKLNGETHE